VFRAGSRRFVTGTKGRWGTATLRRDSGLHPQPARRDGGRDGGERSNWYLERVGVSRGEDKTAVESAEAVGNDVGYLCGGKGARLKPRMNLIPQLTCAEFYALGWIKLATKTRKPLSRKCCGRLRK